MNNVVLTINQTHDIFESDKLHSELRILDWEWKVVDGKMVLIISKL